MEALSDNIGLPFSPRQQFFMHIKFLLWRLCSRILNCSFFEWGNYTCYLTCDITLMWINCFQSHFEAKHSISIKVPLYFCVRSTQMHLFLQVDLSGAGASRHENIKKVLESIDARSHPRKSVTSEPS
jgi:hypothetical protein